MSSRSREKKKKKAGHASFLLPARPAAMFRFYSVCEVELSVGPQVNQIIKTKKKNNISAKILLDIWALQPATCAGGDHEYTLWHPTAMIWSLTVRQKGLQGKKGLVCFFSAQRLILVTGRRCSSEQGHLRTCGPSHRRLGFHSG